MRMTGTIALAVGLSGLAAVGAAIRPERAGKTPLRSEGPRPAPVAQDRFVVHEWGTFTNFAGADGVLLDFRPNKDQELPDFVWDRALQSQSPFCKSYHRTRQRMETPVTYFYTDRPRDVRARVDFPQGLLTEFYPPATEMAPAYEPAAPPLIGNSFLDWGTLRVVPQDQLDDLRTVDEEGNVIEEAVLPAAEGEDHYAYARETDSAVVAAYDPGYGRHYEKFLFYRGIGNFQLPLRFRALGEGRFEVHNFGPDPVESLFLVRIEGGRVRY
jgi:hypothetical protein